MALDIPLRNTNTGQKSLSFLGPKIWSKIGPSIKMLEHRLLSCMLLKKYFTSSAKLIQVITICEYGLSSHIDNHVEL